MRLSEHFTLAEFLASQTATYRGYTEQFSPEPEIIDNIRALAINVLEPLRRAIGVPIRISSGYRCHRLNRAIGGAKFSQHVEGKAADITSPDVSNREIARRIIGLNLEFDQIILEFPDNKGEPAWIHVSHSQHNRKQVLIAERIRNRTLYQEIEKDKA